MSRNQVAGLTAGGPDVRIRDNAITGAARISADRAIVSGNSAVSLIVKRPRVPRSTDGPSGIGPFFISGNDCGGTLRIGESGSPVASAAIQDNTIAGTLRIIASRELQVSRNATAGIACVLSAAESRLVLADNASRGSTGPGLVVVGARNAVIENRRSPTARTAGWPPGAPER